jgi:hypothetical protein
MNEFIAGNRAVRPRDDDLGLPVYLLRKNTGGLLGTLRIVLINRGERTVGIHDRHHRNQHSGLSLQAAF